MRFGRVFGSVVACASLLVSPLLGANVAFGADGEVGAVGEAPISVYDPQTSLGLSPVSALGGNGAAGGGIVIARAPLTGGKFVDVSRETLFSGEMAWLANAKVSTGWPARGGRAYRPLANIERQAMAAFLYRLAGIDKSGYRPPLRATFKDVPVGSQFFKEVEWMAATGITKGWPDKSFRPLGPVNRDAMAAFLARFVKKYPSKVSRAIVELGAPGSAVGNVFVDVPVGTQFAAEMEWLKKTEISTGWVRAGKRFYQPVTPIHRDAMAAFLYRLKNNKAATPITPKPEAVPESVDNGVSTVSVNLKPGSNSLSVPGLSLAKVALVRFSASAPLSAKGRVSTVKSNNSTFWVGRGAEVFSATTFLPVAGGKLVLQSSANLKGRIQVLASFNSSADQAGSTVMLPKIQVLVDSVKHLGLPSVGAKAQSFTATGIEIPTGSRFAIVRLETNYAKGGTVTVAGQTLAMPVGQVATTTVIPLGADGQVSLASTGSGLTRLTAVGYISADLPDQTGANKPSSVGDAFVGLTGLKAQSFKAQANRAVALKVPAGLNAKGFLTLTNTNSKARISGANALPGGAPNSKASSTGTLQGQDRAPELVLTAGKTPQLSASAQGNVQTLPVGYVQDARAQAAKAVGAPSINLTSPKNGASVKVDHGVIRFNGSFTSPGKLDRIEVWVGGKFVSKLAEVTLSGNGGSWRYDLIPPKTETAKVEFRLFDALGRKAVTSWNGKVVLPPKNATIIAPDTKVLSAAQVAKDDVKVISPVHVTSKNKPSFKPGEIVAIPGGKNAPNGLLGQVAAVVYQDGKWNTITRPVQLGNVLLQGDYDLVITKDAAGQNVAKPYVEPKAATKPAPKSGAGAPIGAASAPENRPETATGVANPNMVVPATLEPTPTPTGEGAQLLSFTGEVQAETGGDFNADLDKSLFNFNCSEGFGQAKVERSAKRTTKNLVYSASAAASIDEVKCHVGLNLRVKYHSTWQGDGNPWINAAGVIANKPGLAAFANSLVEGNWKLSTSFLSTVSGSVAATSQGKASIALNQKTFEKTISGTVKFALGPVPVVVNLSGTLTPVMSVELSAAMSGKAGFGASHEFGMSIARGFKVEKINRSSSSKAFEFSGNASATMKAGVALIPQASLYGILTLGVRAEAGLKAQASGEVKGRFVLGKNDPNLEAKGSTSGSAYLTVNGTYKFGLDTDTILRTYGNDQIANTAKSVGFYKDLSKSGSVPVINWNYQLWNLKFQNGKNAANKPENQKPVTAQELTKARKLVEEKCDKRFYTDSWELVCLLDELNPSVTKAINEKLTKEKTTDLVLQVEKTETINDDNLNFPNLEYLNLAYNELGVVPDFSHLPNLKYLNLFANNLRVVPDFSHLPNLESLDLTYNKLGGVPDFSHLPNLESLDLSGNGLGVVPDFSHLPNLEDLSLGGNGLGVVPDFSHLPNLTHLSLGTNELGVVPDFSHLPNLTHLNLDGIGLKVVPDFSHLPNLEWLDLKENGLGVVPDFSHLPNLEWLDLTYNKLGVVPDFSHLPNLRWLDLENNKLKVVPDFSHLPNLEHLELSDNPFEKCPTFTKLPEHTDVFKGC
ncbi:hypothetical protein BK816_07695 [Boudabousia tangfeifanii]|uniref:SLH domain-containing protein n=1 Tax=Boudabousia tangfeifanii TaxID=1912795 RepID=A0A1D9MLM0_9ACTO|nr:leucine-rich repeat domain-containing protein [Boudabousia tangfeifanii]AOZ73192.1 hypothetical protein BK816_07695 [Boudabousia tangfeifanii]